MLVAEIKSHMLITLTKQACPTTKKNALMPFEYYSTTVLITRQRDTGQQIMDL